MARKARDILAGMQIEELPMACADEDAAHVYMEERRWGKSPVCPRCGSAQVYRMTGEAAKKRHLWRCRDCKRQYTVRIGTVFEESQLPLRFWVRAFWEASKAKNGVSALELSRTLGITYKSALFMAHRIRFAMAEDPSNPPKMTGTVEVDEVFIGGRVRPSNGFFPVPGRSSIQTQRGMDKKTPVAGVVQRGGKVRLQVIPDVRGDTLSKFIHQHVDRSARLLTDGHVGYVTVGKDFAEHRSVSHHAGEYVKRHDRTIHTNSIENVFLRLQRSLYGTYVAVSKKHLHRYLAHAAFLHNTRGMTDTQRITTAIRGAEGKRMTYADQTAA